MVQNVSEQSYSVRDELNRMDRFSRASLFFFPAIIFIFGLLFTLDLWRSSRKNLLEIDQNEYRLHAENIIVNLEREFKRVENQARSVGALFTASNEVSLEEFDTYLNVMNPNMRDRHLKVVWLDNANQERPASGMGDSRVSAQSYLFKNESSRKIQQDELVRELPWLHASVKKALESGNLVYSPPIFSDSGNLASMGFAVITPVYKTSLTKQDRRVAEGCVINIVYWENFLESALKSMEQFHDSFKLVLKDDANPMDTVVFFSAHLKQGQIEVSDFSIDSNELRGSKLLDLSGVRWKLCVYSLKNLSTHALAWRELVFGFTVSLFLAMVSVFYLLAHQRLKQVQKVNQKINLFNHHLEMMIAERTSELSRVNADLQGLNQQLVGVMDDLETKRVQLSESNRILEQYAYIASHDLQEPLRKILYYCDALYQSMEARLTDEEKHFMGLAKQASLRMRTLIDDLLNFATLKQAELQLEMADLNDIVRQALDTLEFVVNESGVNIEVDDLPEVFISVPLMRQVFQNLISNAIKFRDKNKSKCWVRIYSKPGDKGHVIYVQDNGSGIREEYHKKIFEIFQRAHGSELVRGSGIGLSVCKLITERHGGQLDLESTPNEGSTFIIRLPHGAG